MDLSIVIPIACFPDRLKFVISRLFATNETFLQGIKSQIIVIDNKTDHGNSEAVVELNSRFCSYDTEVTYLQTDAQGAGHKMLEGMSSASGEYGIFLNDEVISMYDFLEDAYIIARQGHIAGIPYFRALVPEKNTEFFFNNNIFAWSKQLPVFGASFSLTRRSVYLEQLKGVPKHHMTGQNMILRGWEMGLLPVHHSRHLHYPPIVISDSVRPEIYEKGLNSGEDKRYFAESWTQVKILDCWEQMMQACVNLAEDNQRRIQGAGAIKIAGLPNGNFVALLIDEKLGLPPKYEVLGDSAAVRNACEFQLEKWRKDGILILDQYLRPRQGQSKPLRRRIAKRLGGLVRSLLLNDGSAGKTRW